MKCSLVLSLLVLSVTACHAIPTRIHLLPEDCIVQPCQNDVPEDQARAVTLDSERTLVEIAGPVVRMEVQQTYKCTSRSPVAGGEATYRVHSSFPSSLLDYWTSQGGPVQRGVVREWIARNEDSDEKPKPGVAQKILGEMCTLGLGPFSGPGATMTHGFTVLQVVPVQADGIATLWHDLPPCWRERMDWRLSFRASAPREIWSNFPMDVDERSPTVFHLKIRARDIGTKRQIVIRWTIDSIAGTGLVWLDRTGQHFLRLAQIDELPSPFARDPAFTTYFGPTSLLSMEDRRGTSDQRRLAERIPDDWLRRLAESERPFAFKVAANTPIQPSELARLSGRAVVLFEKSAGTGRGRAMHTKSAGEGTRSGHPGATPGSGKSAGSHVPEDEPLSTRWSSAPLSSPPEPGLLEGLELVSIVRGAATRERARARACSASFQKMFASMIGDFETSLNCDVMSHVYHGEPVPSYDNPPLHYHEGGLCQRPACNEWDQYGIQAWCKASHRQLPPGPIALQIPPEDHFAIAAAQGRLHTVLGPPVCSSDRCRFAIVNWGTGVTCLVHGEASPGIGLETSPRSQLVAAGVTDRAILDRAWKVTPRFPRYDLWRTRGGNVGSLLIVWLLLAMCSMLG